MLPTTTQEAVTEEATPAAQVAAPVEPPKGKDGEPFDPTRAQALIEKLQNEVKELKPKAKKLADIEAADKARTDAEKTELEKSQTRLKETEDQLAETNRRLVAFKFHLPDEFSDRIKGKTLEEMEVDAQKLAAALPKSVTISPTNPGSGTATETDAQRKARLFG